MVTVMRILTVVYATRVSLIELTLNPLTWKIW